MERGCLGETQVTRRKGKGAPDRGLKRVFQAAVLFKIGVFSTILLGYFFFPFQAANYEANFHFPPGAVPDLAAHFKTWDAQHYLFLAEQGYHPAQQSNAFYPLFPFLIHGFRFLFFQSSLLAGLFLSNLFSFAALAFLYGLVKGGHGERTALLTCLFFMAFPTAFYMDLVYTESLFLALALGLFHSLDRRRLPAAALCAFLLPLTRPTGLLVGIPALAFLYFNRKGKAVPARKMLALSLAFALGWGLGLAAMGFYTGDFLAAFHAQRFFVSGYGVDRLLHPLDWFRANFIQIPYSWMGFGTGLLDRAFFILSLAGLALGYRLLERPYFIYAAVLCLVPALSGDLASYCRYTAALFPLFLVPALRFPRQAPVLLGISLPIQGALALAHSLNYWVG